jgi:cytochrome b561
MTRYRIVSLNEKAEPMVRIVKYHPALVALHWAMALLIVTSLALGALKMAPLANSDPMKLEALRAHMAGGLFILALLLTRIAVRLRSSRPPAAPTGTALFDRIAPVSHGALYLLVLGMTLSGLTLALQAGLFPIVYAGRGQLPPSLWVFPVRSLHFWISRSLMLLIGLHLAAVAYHLLVVRDRLLGRMWFGRRRIGEA